MLLTLDIGNTQIVAGVFSLRPTPPAAQGSAGRGGLRRASPLAAWRFASDASKTPDEIRLLLSQFFEAHGVIRRSIRGCILASVVPALTAVFDEACRGLFQARPIWVDSKMKLGLKLRQSNPAATGADRLVNAAAAFAFFGGPVVVADFGTATKFEAVTAQGAYLGGAIAPGISISLEALAQRTAKLPRIDFGKPASPIGTDTLEALRSGIYYGSLGQAKELLTRIKRQLGGRPKAVATGGLSGHLPTREMGFDLCQPWLTLQGLHWLYRKAHG